MSEIKLTPSQRAVVEDRGGALLVSAAAGSGKTKVLVDRLLLRICDPVSPCNIDDFLVITYTKAAAAELRMKIAQALSERLSREPGNRHLQRQLNRIYLAEISTVHAFCATLLRTYAHLLDIPGDFRVAEEAESRVMQEQVLQRLLEQSYAQADPEFLAMVEAFGYGRDDRRLPETIKMAHRQMRCRADMEGWLKKNQEILDMTQYADASQTPWGEYLLAEFREFLSRQISVMEAGLEEMAGYPNIQKGLEGCFLENLAQLRRLLACKTWDELVDHRIENFGRAGAVRQPEDGLVKERISKIRTNCWKELSKWQEQFFAHSQEIMEDLSATAAGVQALLSYAKTFDNAYAQEKKQRKILDFSDLEHLAIRLLTDSYTREPTAIAREIAGRYVEIMVDEYQDSNEVQDTIFEAVSQKGQNRFMVGDVKQSIYRFRLAEPELFLEKYRAYPPVEEAKAGEPRKILLSENFRSRREVLSACNQVFGLVMRQAVGDLDYTDEEALKPGRPFPELPDTPVELHCLTHAQPSEDKVSLEAEYVAKRIRQMLDDRTLITDGEGLRPMEAGDVVILMRSLSSTAEVYLQALGQQGIPAVCERGGSLLDSSEVQILVALLQVLDNPHQDIPLLTVLGSPVFGFTPDQLALPRTENRREDYYDTIRNRPEFQEVLGVLDQLREDARWMNLHQLVDSVFRRTGFLPVFASMDDGLRRERDLMAFRSVTVSFEATGARTLAQFLWYLQELKDSGGNLPRPQMAAENAVRIMTVHSSKGLEFPVVFLCDLSRKINLQDMQDAILVDNELGVGCNRVDQRRYVRYPTLAKRAIIHKKTKEAVSEELRVLYVAMTRAKDRLVMTYYSRYLVSELKSINALLTWPLSDDLCASARSPGRWILMSALCRIEAGELFVQAGNNSVSRVWEDTWKISFRDLERETVARGRVMPVMAGRKSADARAVELLQYTYPYREVSDVAGKLTATQLKGRKQDQEVADGATELPRRSAYQFRRPDFLTHAMTGAERGTATHLFLQFADYHACQDLKTIRQEQERLCREEFLTRQQADAVQPEQILRFFRSELGQWLLGQQVRREFKFSILVDAVEYGLDASGEQVMLQGVVDCFVVEDDGLTILDFKTDRTPDPELYRGQLEAYGEALSRIYQKQVKEKILYFFATGDLVRL